jgi:hypothetical protein
VHADVLEQPEIWRDLCGFYSFGPGVLTDPQPRMSLGAGVEVVVRGERLMVRGQMPIPVVRRGLRLHSAYLARAVTALLEDESGV